MELHRSLFQPIFSERSLCLSVVTPTAPPCNAPMKDPSGSSRLTPKPSRSTLVERQRPSQSTDSNWPTWMWTVLFSWHSHSLGGVLPPNNLIPLPSLQSLSCHNAPARAVPFVRSKPPHPPRPSGCHRAPDQAVKFVRIDGTFRFLGGSCSRQHTDTLSNLMFCTLDLYVYVNGIIEFVTSLDS